MALKGNHDAHYDKHRCKSRAATRVNTEPKRDPFSMDNLLGKCLSVRHQTVLAFSRGQLSISSSMSDHAAETIQS